ncbi:hypothetical protein M0R45_030455 [Rubus argutus]|uniref:Uncharacterized protein n=1 Tax=Rubus argutus TaxID=59490 RepID=A0AAW1WD19_RUBAR
MSASRGEPRGWQWFKDPRLDCLSFWGIFPSNTTPPLVEADTETDEHNYLLWRIVNDVAEGSAEIPKGEAIPLEYNLVAQNAISFDKGCYVGQELVACMHHRGVIRKRLLPLKFSKDNGEDNQNSCKSFKFFIWSGYPNPCLYVLQKESRMLLLAPK